MSVDPRVVDAAASAVDLEASLPPKDCPACGKACVVRLGPGGRPFRGCPDWPKCPGKALTLSTHQRKTMRNKLQYAMAYIARAGGPDEAEFWLGQAAAIVRRMKPEGAARRAKK